MEMPINIIVILFVAVIVGSVLIIFTRQNLNDARENLAERFLQEGGTTDDIVEVQNVTETTIISLAEECLDRKQGGFEREVCFALFASSWPDLSALNDTELPYGTRLIIEASPSPSAVKISYDPSGRILVS